MNTHFKSAALGAVVVALIGCASAPKESPILSQARDTVAQAEQDPNVNKYAPTELQRARALLADAEAVAKKKGVNDVAATHDAYSATLVARIAQQRAGEQVAVARIKAGETERQQIDRKSVV